MYEAHSSWHWDEDMLVPVAEINELLLLLLQDRAAAATAPAPRLLGDLRALWSQADHAALQRLAHCPYLLLDAGFSQPACWERHAAGGVVREAAGTGYFENPDGVSLLRHALVFARYLARSHRPSARVLLALVPECADRLATRSLKDLETLAGLAPAWIVPRWDSQITVWRQMLQAAIAGQEEALRRAQLRGLQLMATLW
ncbi:MAG: hypothetical protein WB646_14905, partial [Steroidobacteraceae bacterium]